MSDKLKASVAPCSDAFDVWWEKHQNVASQNAYNIALKAFVGGWYSPDPDVERLVEAFDEAIKMIEFFHGPESWELYRDHSPEMKRLREARAPFPGSPCES